MEETGKWIAGIILSIAALISTWVLARNKGHKDTHKDFYNKLEQLEKSKADKEFVKDELEKINGNINNRLEAHVHESQAVNELLLNAMDKQGDLIKSMDGKLNILIQKIK